MKYQILTYAQAYQKKDFDLITLGSAPFNETRLNPGAPTERFIKSCVCYIDLLKRTFGEPPDKCHFFIVRNITDLGDSYEAAIWYNSTYDEANKYASIVDSGIASWDMIAVRELNEWNVRIYTPPLNNVHDIVASPVKVKLLDGLESFEKCDKEEAEMWSIYAKTEQGTFTISDCLNEEIALAFQLLIKNLIKNWNPNQ